MIVASMTIQGIKYNRQAMATKTTLECLSNEESFKIRTDSTGCVIL